MDFEQVVQVVKSSLEATIQSDSRRYRVPQAEIREFAVSVGLVALGVRTGHLVDHLGVISNKETVFNSLATALHEKNFTNIRLLHLPTADHFLFLNIARLKNRLNVCAIAQRETWPSFVLLEPKPRLIPATADVLSILDNIAQASHGTNFVLEGEHTHVQLIPLVGFLLEYPVTYVPASVEQSSFLEGVPLDVYECKVIRRDTEANSQVELGILMKFSCPSRIATSTPWLESSYLKQQLIDRFQPRLNQYDKHCELAISQEMQTLDRVAL